MTGNEYQNLAMRTSLNTLRDAIYEDAVAHGLWESTDYTVKCYMERANLFGFPSDRDAKLRALAAQVVYMEANELEQAEEADKYAEELADVIIASLSVAGKLGIDIDAAVRSKMEINKARPWKHGKEEQGKA
ncbi:MAG: MazG-like family protein [Candidatus Ventricola sp.]|nr:MazG-like family protein [Clostridiales bacterium]MDY5349298.1 MazG-like family protein [Candidatus Ventricola sp.]